MRDGSNRVIYKIGQNELIWGDEWVYWKRSWTTPADLPLAEKICDDDDDDDNDTDSDADDGGGNMMVVIVHFGR